MVEPHNSTRGLVLLAAAVAPSPPCRIHHGPIRVSPPRDHLHHRIIPACVFGGEWSILTLG